MEGVGTEVEATPVTQQHALDPEVTFIKGARVEVSLGPGMQTTYKTGVCSKSDPKAELVPLVDPPPPPPPLPPWFPTAGFVTGIVLLVTMLVLALVVKSPTPMQYVVFRVVLALSAAAFSMALTGLIVADLAFGTAVSVTAGGTLAVFAVVYLVNPAKLLPTGAGDAKERREV